MVSLFSTAAKENFVVVGNQNGIDMMDASNG